MLPLRLLVARRLLPLRPRHILTFQHLVLSNCRCRSAHRPQYGKHIKDGQDALIRLRLSANRLRLGSTTPRFRIRSLSLLIRERSVLVHGRMPRSSPPSQPTIPLASLPRRRHRLESTKPLPRYRRNSRAACSPHHQLHNFINTRTTRTQPSTTKIWTHSSG